MKIPCFFSPQLATLQKEAFSDPHWIFERKFDGIRCLVFKEGKKVTLYSRNRKILNNAYPKLVQLFAKQKASNFILDGEIVAFEGGKTSFSKLQQTIQRKEASTKVKVYFYAFDLLYCDGKDLRSHPLLERKHLLKERILFSDQLRYTSHTLSKGIESFKIASAKGWEGIIAKRKEAPYLCKRTKNWLKFKCECQGVFLIAGYTLPQGKRVGFGALLLATQRKGKLYYAGKVGTGFDTPFLKAFSEKLSKIKTSKSFLTEKKLAIKGVVFVNLKYCCKIAFTEWTNAKRLRHPRFLKLVKGKR